MKNWLIGTVVVALVAATMPSISEAKRLGGSRSSGMQRDMPARTAPDAPPAKPATPAPGATPAQPGAAAPAAAGATAAAAGAKRSWMGPLAGLAAGLGLVALASALGFGEGLANFLMIALLAVAAIALIAFLMRRFGRQPQPAMAGAQRPAGNGIARNGIEVLRPAQPAPAAPAQFSGSAPAAGVTDPVPGIGGAPVAEPEPEPAVAERSVPKAFVPAAFDSENFARTAKMIFIRLQAANDSADLEDLRRFTTPELFASLRMDILDRGASDNHTDVQRVEAEVLDVTDEEDRQVVSVRFHGDIVEERGGQPQAFNEVWHLVKPHGDGGSTGQWAIAGIEQMN